MFQLAHLGQCTPFEIAIASPAQTRLGKFAVLICYENSFDANWDRLSGRVDFVLSPYNCECDPSGHNVRCSQRTGIPSAFADRTGTVYAGGDNWKPNPGTAGLVDEKGTLLVCSPPGVEQIVVGELTLK